MRRRFTCSRGGKVALVREKRGACQHTADPRDLVTCCDGIGWSQGVRWSRRRKFVGKEKEAGGVEEEKNNRKNVTGFGPKDLL